MSAPQPVTGRCNQAGCQAATTGICIDKLAVTECPHFNLLPPESDAGTPGPRPLAVDMESVGPKRALTTAEADSLRLARESQLIALIAGPEAGKTTLMASIYERVRRRSLGNLRFGGSESIRGFEERCHLSRSISGGNEPDTKRTLHVEPISFLHLRVADMASGPEPVDLIMADRKGEAFSDVLDQPAKCRSINELATCDIAVFLMDGDLLLANSTRYGHLSDTRRLVRAVHETGVLKKKAIAQLVLTKCDKVYASTEKDEVVKEVKSVAQELSQKTAGRLEREVRFVAARRRSQAVPAAFGLEDLVRSWNPKPFISQAAFAHSSPAQDCSAMELMMLRFAEERH
jgi:hypothetical protein